MGAQNLVPNCFRKHCFYGAHIQTLAKLHEIEIGWGRGAARSDHINVTCSFFPGFAFC